MDVDYDVYAEGEALLGWLNATCRVSRRSRSTAIEFLRRLADRIQHGLAERGIEIAHFKMTLAPDTGNDLAVLNLVRTDGRAESVHRLAERPDRRGADRQPARRRRSGTAEGAVAVPALEGAAREMGVSIEIEHIEHFRPGRPEPTHRMATP